MKNSRYTVDSRGRYYRHFEIKIETENIYFYSTEGI